jgi:2-methylcitrate dehydratase PrpD
LSQELTDQVSEFIVNTTLDSIPQSVIEAAKRSMLDGFGLAVAGSRTDVFRIAQAEVCGYRAQLAESSVLGTVMRTPARFAAFLTGIAVHADDYDDTQLAVAPDRVYGLLTHPTAPVLGATLAVAEATGASGTDLLLSYLVGVEVETKVCEAISPRHYDDGFHSTATVGAIGAGAGVARLLGMDLARAATTLGVAATQAAGLRENFGTMTKPFHAGRAAESGVVAASLVGSGMTAAQNILEARRGFFSAAGGGYDPEMIFGKLGNPWTFDSPGVSIKPFPTGSLSHPAMTAMLDLVVTNDLHVDDVEEVYVGTNRHMPNALIHSRPMTDLEAKFSMEFCVAILLLRRRAGLEELTDEVVRSAEVQDAIRRVRFEVDPEAEAAGYDNMASIVRIKLKDGRLLEQWCSYSKGQPQNPMTLDELTAKFASCVSAGGISADAGRRAAGLILALEKQDSLDSIVSALSAGATD